MRRASLDPGQRDASFLTGTQFDVDANRLYVRVPERYESSRALPLVCPALCERAIFGGDSWQSDGVLHSNGYR